MERLPTPFSRDASPEPQVVEQALMIAKKKEIVDKLLETFCPLFNKWMEQRFGAVRQAVHDAESSGKLGSYQSGGGGPKKASGGQKRQKREAEDDDHPDDNEDGEDGERGGNNKRSRRGSDAKLMFACPYYKRNPTRYASVRQCCGPGWYDVHRVK